MSDSFGKPMHFRELHVLEVGQTYYFFFFSTVGWILPSNVCILSGVTANWPDRHALLES